MSNNADYFGTLEGAILIKHKCKATHRETVFVGETTVDGEIVWQGDVESFDLAGHAAATKCYAWRHLDGRGHMKIFTVLGSKLVDSPNRAVQVAIFAGAQPSEHRFSKEMESLKQQLEECKQLFQQMGMKAEGLAAAIQSGQGIQETVKTKARNR